VLGPHITGLTLYILRGDPHIWGEYYGGISTNFESEKTSLEVALF